MAVTIPSNVEQQENIDEESDLLVCLDEGGFVGFCWGALLDLDCVMNGWIIF